MLPVVVGGRTHLHGAAKLDKVEVPVAARTQHHQVGLPQGVCGVGDRGC